MTISKRTVTTVTGLVFVALLVAAAYAKKGRALKTPPLGIEVKMTKPFYVPARTGTKTTMVFIRVPTTNGSPNQEAVSVVKLEPRMEGDKVRVAVFALVGDADHIKTCRDWDALKSVSVGTYVAGVDEEVSLKELRAFGVSMGSDFLTFRVVPKRTLSPVPPDMETGGCECGSCDGLICCPNSGYCIGCGSCGSVCCK